MCNDLYVYRQRTQSDHRRRARLYTRPLLGEVFPNWLSTDGRQISVEPLTRDCSGAALFKIYRKNRSSLPSC